MNDTPVTIADEDAEFIARRDVDPELERKALEADAEHQAHISQRERDLSKESFANNKPATNGSNNA